MVASLHAQTTLSQIAQAALVRLVGDLAHTGFAHCRDACLVVHLPADSGEHGGLGRGTIRL